MKHTIIKLGGSVITDKTKPKTLNYEAIKALTTVINQYQIASDEKVWLFHGAGSFAHFSAAKWQTSNDDQYFYQAGDEVLELNQIITERLKIPFNAASARNFWHNADKQWQAECRQKNLFVGHGDIATVNQRQQIVSADTQIAALSQYLAPAPQRILFLADTNGVLDAQKNTITQLSAQNLPLFFNTNKTDVTGGMAGKLEKAFKIVSKNTAVTIASGLDAQNLTDWLAKKKIEGTVLKA